MQIFFKFAKKGKYTGREIEMRSFSWEGRKEGGGG